MQGLITLTKDHRDNPGKKEKASIKNYFDSTMSLIKKYKEEQPDRFAEITIEWVNIYQFSLKLTLLLLFLFFHILI